MRWGAGSFGSRDVGTEPAETLIAIESSEQSDCENRAAARAPIRDVGTLREGRHRIEIGADE